MSAGALVIRLFCRYYSASKLGKKLQKTREEPVKKLNGMELPIPLAGQ